MKSNYRASKFGIGAQNGKAILSSNSGSVWGCMPLAGMERISDSLAEEDHSKNYLFEQKFENKETILLRLCTKDGPGPPNFNNTFTSIKKLIFIPFIMS